MYMYIYITHVFLMLHFLFRVPSAYLGAISLLVADAVVYGGASVAWLCLHDLESGAYLSRDLGGI